MIDMLLKLNVGSADTTSHINIAGNVKNNLIYLINLLFILFLIQFLY